MRVLWVVGLWLAAGSGLAQRPAPPNLPVVTKVEIKFQTNDDNKDDDTRLSVYFSCDNSSFADADGSTMSALVANDPIAYLSHEETQWAPVPIHPNTKIYKAKVHSCTTTVRIDPNGHDTWKFNYLVKLEYSDGTRDEYHFNGHALSQDYRQNTYPLR